MDTGRALVVARHCSYQMEEVVVVVADIDCKLIGAEEEPEAVPEVKETDVEEVDAAVRDKMVPAVDLDLAVIGMAGMDIDSRTAAAGDAVVEGSCHTEERQQTPMAEEEAAVSWDMSCK